jgi:hypothetical protein
MLRAQAGETRSGGLTSAGYDPFRRVAETPFKHSVRSSICGLLKDIFWWHNNMNASRATQTLRGEGNESSI